MTVPRRRVDGDWVGDCPCGQSFYFSSNPETQIHECRSCGRHYNWWGQELRSSANYSETRSELWMETQVEQEVTE